MAISPEHEANIEYHAIFLGGLFGIAGHLGIVPRRVKTKAGGYRPAVEAVSNYTDNRPEKIKRFGVVFGGRSIPVPSINSYKWEVSTRTTIALAETIYDYAPAKKSKLDLIRALAETADIDERVMIAEEFKALEDNIPSVEEYLRLLLLPPFVAGIFEARGHLYYPVERSRNVNYDTPYIILNTSIPTLLEGLDRIYGGTPVYSEGIWKGIKLPKEVTHPFLDSIQPHMVNDLDIYKHLTTF